MMTKKSTLIFFLFLTISFSVLAQQKRVKQLPSFDKYEINWGFYLGWNNSDYNIKYKENSFSNTKIHFDNKMGFNVGLIANMRINDHFSLRFEPGLVSNASTVNFIDQNYIDGTSATNLYESNSTAEITATFLHVPLLLKLNATRLNNVRPYLIGGFSYDHNFSSQEDNKDDNFSSQFRMRTHNFMYEVGFGFDFYFHYFKFSPSIRGQFAMTNELYYDDPLNGASPWTDPIGFMGSRSLFIKLAFE